MKPKHAGRTATAFSRTRRPHCQIVSSISRGLRRA